MKKKRKVRYWLKEPLFLFFIWLLEHIRVRTAETDTVATEDFNIGLKDMGDAKHSACKSTGGRPPWYELATKAASDFKGRLIGWKSIELLIQNLSFQKLVREIVQDFKIDLRFQNTARGYFGNPVKHAGWFLSEDFI